MSFIPWATSTQRQAAQCVGRVIRSKADYGMMIFADKRYLSVELSNSVPTSCMQI